MRRSLFLILLMQASFVPSAYPAITVDIDGAWQTVAVVMTPFGLMWDAATDNDATGTADLAEAACLEAVLASGSHPSLEAAWIANRAQGLINAGATLMAVTQNSLAIVIAQYTTIGTEAGMQFWADFFTNPTIIAFGGTWTPGNYDTSQGRTVFGCGWLYPFLVDPNATGANNGTSWPDAFTNIQTAIDVAFEHGGGSIWVAEGIFALPTDPVVVMRQNVHVYGGFARTETILSQRNLRIHQTIIDGQNVRRGVAGADNATLHGFTVTRALGGGMVNAGTSPIVANCVFAGNTGGDGGGMINISASPAVSNCLFLQNHASNSGSGGGAIGNSGASAPTITNCTFWGNSGGRAAGIYNNAGASFTRNCILWGNLGTPILNDGGSASVTYSCVEGGFAGTGNINADPLFSNPVGGDFRVRFISPCLDTGTSTGAPDSDIESNPRPFDIPGVGFNGAGQGYDMGAYESGDWQDIDADGLPDVKESSQGCSDAVADARLTTTLIAPSDRSSFRTLPIAVSGSASSPYINTVRISTDGGASFPVNVSPANLSWSYNWTPPASGTYSIVARAANVFGGYTDSEPLTINYFTNNPTGVISAPIRDQHVQGSVTVSGSAGAGLLGFSDYVIAYRAGTDPNGEGGWTALHTGTSEVTNGVLLNTWNVAGLVDGPYVLRMRVTDGAQIQTATTHVQVYVDGDTIAPVAPWSLEIEGAVNPGAVKNGSVVNVVGNAPPDTFASVAEVLAQDGTVLSVVTNKLTIHKNGSIRGSFSLPGSLSTSQISLRIRVRDAAGNVSGPAASNALSVDNDPPTVNILFPVTGSTLPLDLIVVNGQAIDNGVAGLQKIEFSTNGTNYSLATGTADWSYGWTPPTDGTYTLYVRGTDTLGNQATSNVVTTINSNYPSAYITSPAQGQEINEGAQLTITGTAKDTTNFSYYRLQYAPGVSPSSGWVNITAPQVTTPVTNGTLATWNTSGLANGVYTIRVIVLDLSGNIVLFDMQVNIVSPLNLAGIPDATLNQGATIQDFVHLPAHVSALSGNPETFVYNITGNTEPNCGVSIDANRNLDISPAAGWSGTSTVTVQVSNGPLSDADVFTITVRPLNAMVVSVTPSLAWPGHLVQVNIQGASTHFTNSSVIDFGTETWVDNIVANSPTSLSATLAISWAAPSGLRDVQVTTGSETVTGSGMFHIRPVGSVPTPQGLTATAGATSIFLTWTPSSAFFVTGYNVYRDTQLDGDYLTKLNPTPVTTAAYEDTSVSPGVTYYYRITAVTVDPYESPKSEAAWATAGQIVVSMPDVRADAGDQVRLTINLDAAWGVAGSGMEIHLSYNPTILTPVAVETTVLTQGFQFVDNVGTANGQLDIVGLGGDTLAGEGHILDVLFDVAAGTTAGATAPLSFTEVVMFNWELNELQVDYSDTATFTVSPAYVLGDLTGDGSVNVADAVLAQRIANGEVTPTELQLMAGDITGEGVIDSADVTLILRIIVGLPINPPQTRGSVSNIAAGDTREGATYVVSLDDGYGFSGSTVPVSVNINSAAGVAACDFAVTFDSTVLTVSNVRTSSMTSGFSLQWNVSGGLLTVSMASNNALASGSGAICFIDVVIRPTTIQRQTMLNLASTKLSGQYGNNLGWRNAVTGMGNFFTVLPVGGIATTWVDFQWGGAEAGSQTQPFDTLGEGITTVVTGGTVNIKAGQSTETPRITKPLLLIAVGGTVRIGVTGTKMADSQTLEQPLMTVDAGDLSSSEGSGLLQRFLGDLTAQLADGEPVREGNIFEPVIPYTRATDGALLAAQDSLLAVRILSTEDIAPESLEAAVESADGRQEITWQPVSEGNSQDIWVLVKPDDRWMMDDLIGVRAAAHSITGTPIESAQFEFRIGIASETAALEPPQTDSVQVGEAGNIRPVVSGIDSPVAIEPERVYSIPQSVWLPIPAGVNPQEVRLYYYHASAEDRGWYPAESVDGWLVPNSYEIAEIDGTTYLGFLVQHAGIVQLGIAKP